MTVAASQSVNSRAATDRPVRRRVLILSSHVVPYASPLYQVLARDPRLDIQVAYCSLQGAERGYDPEFGVELQWDKPLLDGYPWSEIQNKALKPRLGSFFGLWNPGLWKLIRRGGFDAVVIYTGYMYASFWLAVAAAKSKRIPVLISSDSISFKSREGVNWKSWVKPFVLGRVYRSIDTLMASSQAVRRLAISVGMPPERIVEVRSGMAKEDWQARAEALDGSEVRKKWNVPTDAKVALFCGKLQEWKRPLDLVRAFARVELPRTYLVIVGEGPQREEVEREIDALGIRQAVRLTGFVNASQLPGVYKAADVLVLPSRYDGCPLVVPEAMFSGIPVILSDTVQGRIDMIQEGKSGYIFRFGDIEQLAFLIRKIFGDEELLSALKLGVRSQMHCWTSENFADTWIEAVDVACARKHRR